MKVNEIVTNRIIEKIESGRLDWKKGWNAERPQNYLSKKEYQGINTLILLMANRESHYWLTFKQINELGGSLKAGSISELITFYTLYEPKDEGEEKDIIPLLRYYRVFNLADTNLEVPKKEVNEFSPIETADKIIKNFTDKPPIIFGGGQAYYSPSTDEVHLPIKESFKSNYEYYSVAFHELGHATGHDKRLSRKDFADINSFGSESYSKEELIAELTSAFLCNKAKLINETIDNSSAYLQGWLKVLKADSNFIIRSASQAQKAYDYILKNHLTS